MRPAVVSHGADGMAQCAITSDAAPRLSDAATLPNWHSGTRAAQHNRTAGREFARSRPDSVESDSTLAEMVPKLADFHRFRAMCSHILHTFDQRRCIWGPLRPMLPMLAESHRFWARFGQGSTEFVPKLSNFAHTLAGVGQIVSETTRFWPEQIRFELDGIRPKLSRIGPTWINFDQHLPKPDPEFHQRTSFSPNTLNRCVKRWSEWLR